jgi:hypothetical protein
MNKENKLKEKLLNLTLEYSEKHLGKNNSEERIMRENIDFLTNVFEKTKTNKPYSNDVAFFMVFAIGVLLLVCITIINI